MDENKTFQQIVDDQIKMIKDNMKITNCQEKCANYIDDTFANVNCTGCTMNPFYMNCFIEKQ